MTAAIATFIVSTTLFVAFALLVHVEQKNARRLVGGRLRASLDSGVQKTGAELKRRWRHVMRYVVQLGWYYGIHSLLRAILKVLVSIYAFFEHMFEQNRLRTKQLRRELKRHIGKTHLTQVADHKAKSVLSPQEQEELKKQKLENNH